MLEIVRCSPEEKERKVRCGDRVYAAGCAEYQPEHRGLACAISLCSMGGLFSSREWCSSKCGHGLFTVDDSAELAYIEDVVSTATASTHRQPNLQLEQFLCLSFHPSLEDRPSCLRL